MNSKLKIGGCVVLYNPDVDVLDNISTYIDVVEELIIVDNSSKKAIFLESLEEISKIKYVFMNGNKGIASALDRGIRILHNDGFDVALTMDQDSKFPQKYVEDITAILNEKFYLYSVIGLNFNNNSVFKSDEIKDVSCWLTSGNFVKIDDYINIGGFYKELFIDYVDIEYGYKLHKNGKRIGYLINYSLEHKIGNPIEINILGFRCYAMNHTSIRYYYRYRNSFYLFLNEGNFFRTYFLKEMFINIPKMLFFEPDKIPKIKMLSKGLYDAYNGTLGVYKDK